MIKQLANIYPSLIIYNQNEIDSIDDYQWFISENREIIGIKQTDLVARDKQILSAFLKEYNMHLPRRSAQEQLWFERIHSSKNMEEVTSFRFVYFQIEQQDTDLILFKETINAFFGKEVPVLFIDGTTGIIVEELSITEDKIDYHQLIEMMMSDLFITVKFFIGEVRANLVDLQNYYTTMHKNGKLIFKSSKKDVTHFTQSIPYLILDNLDTAQKETLATNILKDFRKDEEMLKTIQLFLDHNQNVSETAKQMYMHRNSLQYRIDKFMQGTHINIQEFNGALTVQLGLLLHNSLD